MNIRSNPETTRAAVTTGALPSSKKIYATPASAPELRVPLREIILSEAASEPNLPVYDTSGPYTDPAAAQKAFDRYKKCERIYARCYHNGTPIRQLTVAA